MNEDVEADHIHRAECRCFRASDERPGQSVDFLDRESALLHQLNRFESGKKSDSIRDEIRSVVRMHHAFAKRNLCELFEFG